MWQWFRDLFLRFRKPKAEDMWEQAIRQVVAASARRNCLNLSLQAGRYLTPEQQAAEGAVARAIARKWARRFSV